MTGARRSTTRSKTSLVIHETCHRCCLSPTSEGTASDQTIAELAGYTLPPGSCLYQDKGFQGFCLAGIIRFQPQKKPRGRHSLSLRKRPIVESRPSVSGSNMPLVV